MTGKCYFTFIAEELVYNSESRILEDDSFFVVLNLKMSLFHHHSWKKDDFARLLRWQCFPFGAPKTSFCHPLASVSAVEKSAVSLTALPLSPVGLFPMFFLWLCDDVPRWGFLLLSCL